MRHIYLVRHCRPEFPDGRECCISQSDYPLSKEGLHQAQVLGGCFGKIPLTAVYSSTLSRSVQTAKAIAQPGTQVIQNAALREICCGLWEGLTLAEVKQKYPEQYAMRGIDPVGFVPEGAEGFTEGLARFKSAMARIINESTGDIAIVAHASVNRLFLCALQNKALKELYTISQPYGCVNDIILEDNTLRVEHTGYLMNEIPDEETIRCLYERYGTPTNVIAHCRAVAAKAVSIAVALAASGCKLNERLVFSAAMLHDIARQEPDHAELGAKWLAKEGYKKVADIVARHHNLGEGTDDPVTESTVVFLADKLVCKDREVTLEERFIQSAKKCVTLEAKVSHKRKYEEAALAKLRVQRQLGKEIIYATAL